MATLWVRHSTSSAALVRDRIADNLRRIGVADSDVFDATILASELVANAVRHAPPLRGDELRVEWAVNGTTFEVAVTDGGEVQSLNPLIVQPWEISGRGLAIVAAIADEWGLRPGEGETTVWAAGTLHSATSAASVEDLVTNC